MTAPFQLGVGRVWINEYGTVSFTSKAPRSGRQVEFTADTIGRTARPSQLRVCWRGVRLIIDLRTGRVHAFSSNGEFVEELKQEHPIRDVGYISAEDLFRVKLWLTCTAPSAQVGSSSSAECNRGSRHALQVKPERRVRWKT